MNLESRIIIEDGDVFDGTRGEFIDAFFSDATDDEIKDWCFDNDWSLVIDDVQIL